ncbi:MAG: helix-turn-helix domain-containing protein [Cyclobacteriaceae bacterium]
MYHKFSEPKLNALLSLTDNVGLISDNDSIQKGLIHILWNRSEVDAVFYIDNLPITLKPQQLTTCTYLQKATFPKGLPDLTIFSFNREFYCIQDHDHEVSCNGIIFFGTQEIPIITVENEEVQKLETLLGVFIDEFATKDNIQGEMLQMLLKRLIIKCTRLARIQLISHSITGHQIDVIRKFNVLVDMHYKSKKQVADYAELLNKSPKTLANLFSLYGSKTPLRIIHERIALEGKRLISFTDKTSKEVAFELGFEDVPVFNKIFKKTTGYTPTEYKKSLKSA